MSLSLKESRVVSEMAKVLYNFLPWSGWKQWKGHISFQSVAQEVGVGDFWQIGSKEPGIAAFLERTLEFRRHLFEKLILAIVKAALKYRQKNNTPIKEDEIKTLNGLILEIGFKFPSLWDPNFLESLKTDGVSRATKIVEQELAVDKVLETKQAELIKKRELLKAEFYEFSKQKDRQAAGLKLEKILNELFELSGMTPRMPFRVVGEQIDGSFMLDNEIYLLEAKWESYPLSEAPLLIFRGKIEGKSSFTRGVFVAINGCSPQALSAITSGKQPNFFLVDGYDFTTILEGTLSLIEILRLKLRRLAEEGKVFVSAREFL